MNSFVFLLKVMVWVWGDKNTLVCPKTGFLAAYWLGLLF